MKKIKSILLVLLLTMPSCKTLSPIKVTLHLNGGYLNNQETLKLSLDEFLNLKEYPVKEDSLFTTYYLDNYLLNEFNFTKNITTSIDLYADYVPNIIDYELVDDQYVVNDIYEDTYEEVNIPKYLYTKRVTTLNTYSLNNIKVNTLNIKYIENIKIDAFKNSEIQYLKIGSYIKNIEYGSFRKISLLKNVTMDFNKFYSVSNGVILERKEDKRRTIIGTYGDDKSMFNEGYFDTIEFDSIAPYAVSNLYYYDEKLTTKGYSFYIPSTITSLSDYAFNEAKVIAYNKENKNVIQLGVFLFNNLKEIGKYAFSNSSLTLIKYQTSKEDNVVVPSKEGVEVFKEGAFQNLDIINLTLPLSLRKIEKDCFKYTNPSIIYYEGTEEDFKKIEIESGNESLNNAKIYFFSKEYKENHWYYDSESVSNPKLY